MKYYTYLGLDKGSRAALVKAFKERVPNWRDYPRLMADHMTIGYCEDEQCPYDGQKFSIKVKAFGIDDKNAAVLVNDGGLSNNRKPHVTIGVASGGHGADSNKLKFDEKFPNLTLTGKVKSMEQTNKKYSNIGGPHKYAADKMMTCDRLRRTDSGEAFWQDMMDTRKKVSEREFLRNVKIKDVLDDGETWDEYRDDAGRQGDPIKFFKSKTGTYFFQTAGFEFIWLDGKELKKVRASTAMEVLRIARIIIGGPHKSAATLQDLNPEQWKEYKELFDKKYKWNHPERNKKMKEFKKKHGFR